MILLESSRDNLLTPYLNILNSKGINCTLSQLKQFLLAKFVNEANIRSLSLDSNYYLAGVARYYFEGKLTVNKNVNALFPKIKDVFNTEICQRLSALILILRNSYIDSVGTQWEQPEDFGELPLEKLLKKYNKVINNELGIVTEKKPRVVQDTLDRNTRVGNGYTFEILYSYEEAKKYNKYTEPGAWCITYGQQHYNGYIRRLGIHYVIFAKDGFENIPRKKGQNWTKEKPQDEYGNSLIALLQSNTDGRPIYITSRWNHGTWDDDTSCEADHAYTTEEFMNITGVSQEDLNRIFKIWKKDREVVSRGQNEDRKELNKKRLNVLRIIKYAQMKINGGNFDGAFGEYNFSVMDLLSKQQEVVDKYELLKRSDDPKEKKLARKIENDSIKSCRLIIDDDIYFFLMDKNKILFETIVESDGAYDSGVWHFSSSLKSTGNYHGADAAHFNNVILCTVVNGYMIYDMRRHLFVDVDGKKKFKYITSIWNYQVKELGPGENAFYEVKMSEHQGALIDWKTNIPLKLPNGSCWCESVRFSGKGVNYRRSVECDFISQKSKILSITYDSASREMYFYDCASKQFIKPELFGDDTKPDLWSSDFPDNMYAFVYRDNENYPKFYVLYKEGQKQEIDGYNLFKYIDYGGRGFIAFETIDGKKRFYNYFEKREYPVPFNWEEVSVRIQNEAYGNSESSTLCSFSVNNSSFGKDYRYIFSLVHKKFLENPIRDNLVDNPYLFHIYGCNLYSGRVTVYNTNKEEFDAGLKHVALSLNDNTGELDVENVYESTNKKRILRISEEEYANIVMESAKSVLSKMRIINESKEKLVLDKLITKSIDDSIKKQIKNRY